MTLDESTPEVVEAPAETTRPRRRRATKAAAAPQPSAEAPAQAEAPAAVAEPGVADHAAAESEPAAPPARRRRATSPRPAKAAKAAPAAVDAPQAAVDASQAAVTEPAAPEVVPDASDAAPAEVKPARSRRRASKKTAEPPAAEAVADQAGTAVGSDTPDVVAVEVARPAAEPAPEAAPAEQADAPATSRRRRGRATKVAAAPAVDEPAVAAAAPVAEDGAVLAADVPAAPAPEVSAPVEQASSRGRRAPLAATALLFQPPDAAPRRRRAASRPSGPPVDADPAAEVLPDADEVAEALEELAEQLVPATEADPTVEDDAAEAGDAEDEDAADDAGADGRRRRRRRGGRGRRGRGRGESDGADAEGSDDAGEQPAVVAEVQDEEAATEEDDAADDGEAGEGGSSRRRRRRRRRGGTGEPEAGEDPPGITTRIREPRRSSSDDVTALKGSTRLEAKKQRRREGRDAGRRRVSITEAEFLARRESVERVMVVRQTGGRTQIGVLEDGVLVEHYVARQSQTSTVGNVYLGKVQNVLPSMEAAFVDIGKGRNAVLYAGEVNWDAAGLEGQPKRIEHALKSGESVLVQVTKDPIGHKGARLTSQISLPGRYLVYVPDGSMTGISRKLPDNERTRLKRILREVVPDDAGVIVRTAAEGASEEELRADVARLQAQWADIKAKSGAVNPPTLLYGEPDLAIRVVRDIFNEDIATLLVSGDETFETLQSYVGHVAPDLADRLQKWEPVDADGKERGDVFAAHRIDEQLAKALDRKVWLPSGGSLVIDRTEAMTVVDVNTGKFTGAGGNLEETVTKNNLEAAEEIVRQLRLRDIGGIIVVDFIDMVLESNRELVLRRLLECLGRDRTKHQVAEVTSLGLVQMTRKRVGQGLLEVFSESCEHCNGRGVIIHDEPVEKRAEPAPAASGSGSGGNRRRKG
ncbi:MAG: Rne/Rng family ribonuclease [Kineosporiaceae bacterium]